MRVHRAIVVCLEAGLKKNDFVGIRDTLGDHEFIQLPLGVLNLIPDHPRQRNTEKRCDDWLRQRDLDYRPTHKDFAAVMLPTGEFWMLDGHTRRRLYQGHKGHVLEHPPGDFVNLTIKRAKDRDEALQMIRLYDAAPAVETGRHIIEGTQREHGVSFQSPFLRTGTGHKDALRYSYAILTGNEGALHARGAPFRAPGSIQHDELTEMFFRPLVLIDRTNPTGKTHQQQFLIAELITAIVDGPALALDGFFGPYADEAHHAQTGLAKNAFKHLFDRRGDKRDSLHHYSGSQTYENVKIILQHYEEHLHRVRNGLPTTFELTRRYRTGWVAPGCRSGYDRISLQRYAIGEAALRERIAAMEI